HQFAVLLVVAHDLVEFRGAGERRPGGLLGGGLVRRVEHQAEGGAHVRLRELVALLGGGRRRGQESRQPHRGGGDFAHGQTRVERLHCQGTSWRITQMRRAIKHPVAWCLVSAAVAALGLGVPASSGQGGGKKLPVIEPKSHTNYVEKVEGSSVPFEMVA